MYTYVIAMVVSMFALAFAGPVFAASMYLVPEQGNVNREEEFSVDVKIDSEGEGINAAEATLSWPENVLEVIEIDKNGSVFSFWVEEPTLSAASNAINFIGGTTKGISSGALQVFTIKFKGTGVGIAELSISDAAITASDGKGTNVLSKLKGASFHIVAEVMKPDAPASLPSAVPQDQQSVAKEVVPDLPSTGVVQQPKRVERTAITAAKLPQKPTINVPLYPDEKKWHNHLGEMVALWDVPDDVLQVAIALDNSPNTEPQVPEPELVTGKKFEVLAEGIWYVHARFKNNIGWGSAAHYRIALDTAPPLAFEVTASEGSATDNPAPIIKFTTSDALSGLWEYHLTIDDGELIKINSEEFDGAVTLPLLAPGAHRVVIQAWDFAENSIADDLAIEILPIPSPSITFVTREIFSEEARGLTVKGTAFPGLNVLLQVQQLLKTKKGEVIAKSVALTDERGNWEFTFNEPLRNGRYVVAAQSQDVRGALSLAVESSEVVAKSKPIIQLGFLQFGKGTAALLLLCILITGFGGGVWFYTQRQKKLRMRVSFAELEITKIFKLMREDVERLRKARASAVTSDSEYALKTLQKNMQKMESYLKQGVEKIKK